MIRKILEAFFRHKLLLLLPPFLIPGIVSPIAILTTPPLYDSSISVWVDHPAYLNYNDGANAWLSPSASQSGKLSELLRTRAFMVDVAKRTSLAPLVGSPAGEARIADLIAKSVSFGGAVSADHLLVIHVQASTAQLSFELCKAVVDAYQEKSAADQSDQAGLAVDFYQARVTDAQQQLTKSTGDLRRYVSSHQADGSDAAPLTDPLQNSLPASMLDARFSALQATTQTAQRAYDTAQAALTQAEHDAVASAQGQQYGFQVLDPAQLPTAPVQQTKKIIIYPIAAAIVGLAVSVMLLVVLVATDRSVRTEADLTSGVRVLGIVPTMKLRRVPKNLRGVATRRAIGAIAGTALPAPSGAK